VAWWAHCRRPLHDLQYWLQQWPVPPTRRSPRENGLLVSGSGSALLEPNKGGCATRLKERKSLKPPCVPRQPGEGRESTMELESSAPATTSAPSPLSQRSCGVRPDFHANMQVGEGAWKVINAQRPGGPDLPQRTSTHTHECTHAHRTHTSRCHEILYPQRYKNPDPR